MTFKRMQTIRTACFVILALLGVRIVYIMVQNGKAYEAMAISQQKRTVTVKNIRGKILDKSGTELTDTALEDRYLLSDGTLADLNKNAKFKFKVPKREAQTARHLIGYTSFEGEGLCGIEKQFDFLLKNNGKIALSYMADATGAPIDSFNILNQEDNSTSVSLTIDGNIQKIAEEVMDKYIKKGAVVILDCKSFDVAAMVSRPDYNLKKLKDYSKSENGELLNRALMSYNAGSVFKIITASAALEKNTQYTKKEFNCDGTFKLNDGTTFGCHNANGHGKIDFSKAFALSCNCSFYETGLELGGTEIVNMAKRFGMGQNTLDLNLNESAGNLPQKNEYTNGDVLNLAIGQGEILITPLQCAVITATIANGGIRQRANVVAGYTDQNGKYHNLKSRQSFKVIKRKTAEDISEMMRDCVVDGTATGAKNSSVNIAGKTGSAETGWVQNGKALVHGWFCGYFPYEKPRYAAVVFSEGGESGAGSCVVPFVEIAEKINEIYPFKQ